MSGKFDGSIRIDSSIDSKGFNKGIDGMTGLVKKLGAALAVAFSVKVIANFTANAAKLSAEFQRLAFSAQAVGQLQGYAAGETRALVAELIESGIQTDTANRAFINFAKEGLDTNLLPALAQGAQDLAVFANSGETSSDMLDRLTDGVLTMNSLMLRNAKVSIDVEGAQKAYGATIGKTTEQMTIQEKRQGVLLAVTEKLRAVSGLYGQSQELAAGQLASNIRVTNELKAAIGSPFQNALFILIKAWNTLLKAMTRAIGIGGSLRATFVKIGAIASILAQIFARLFNAIAALFGIEKTGSSGAAAMEGLADGSEDAAAGQDALGDSTEAAGKKAKGALASFDDLNVLQQDTGDGAGGGAGGDAGGLGGLDGLGTIDPSQFTNPMDEIIAKADELKAELLENKFFLAFARVFEAGQKLFNSAIVALTPLWDWFTENVLDPLGEMAGEALLIVLDLIAKALENMSVWIDNNQEAYRAFAAAAAILLLGLFVLGTTIGAIIAIIIGLIFIIANAGKAWTLLKELAVLAWEIITKLWIKAGEWFKTHVTEPIKEAFSTAFEAVENIVKSILNRIIDFMNSMIAGVISGINSVINAANTVGSIVPGYSPVGQLGTPQIPHLATGAVIPPNAQFAAILGDQKSGRNIEAPESLIRQIVREETAGRGGGDENFTVEAKGQLGPLIRLLNLEIKKDNARVGVSLVSGGSIE